MKLALLLTLAAAAGARAQSCGWTQEFPQGSVDAPVRAMATVNFGAGPRLFVGGDFQNVPPFEASRVASWDGMDWSTLGGGTDGSVRALLGVGTGTTASLYAGGDFGAPGAHVARWDGTAWNALGAGLDRPVNGLALHNGFVYAVGKFVHSGTSAISGVARWTGTQWAPVGGGSPNEVFCAASFGGSLYIGGQFTTVGGGVPAVGIARWDGSQWHGVGGGVNNHVKALAVHDDGTGPALYVGGLFSAAGGVSRTSRIARWNGSAWSPLENGMQGGVAALLSPGPMFGGGLYVGGDWLAVQSGGSAFAGGVLRWNGAAWERAGDGGPRDTLALGALGEPLGPSLFAGGTFVGNLGRMNNDLWSLMKRGPDGNTWQSAEFGGELYVTGDFRSADGIASPSIAIWTGTRWRPFPGDRTHYFNAFVKADIGQGENLYVGGMFERLGSETVNNVARWDGSAWHPVGSGVSGVVGAMVRAPALGLLVGGQLVSAGGAPARNVACWNGAEWSALGDGLEFPVVDLEMFDDGSGVAVYAASILYTGWSANSRVQKWSGQHWDVIAESDSGFGDLQAFSLNGRPALFVSGELRAAGGSVFHHVGAWDGVTWTDMDAGYTADYPPFFRVLESGGVARLYGAGEGVDKGLAWTKVYRLGVNGWDPMSEPVNSWVGGFSAVPYGPVAGLWLTGAFSQAGPFPTTRLAHMTCATCYADCNEDGALNLADFGCFQTKFALGDPYADCNGDAALNLADFGCFQTRFALGCP